ncbi:lipopolysaccharide kinase InaA family protein [Pseudomonas nicosulfuronedens]
MTLHAGATASPSTLAGIAELIRQRDDGRRIVGCVQGNGALSFVKVNRVDGLRRKVRLLLGRQRRQAGFDWMVAELLNTAEASARNAPVPAVHGFGYRKRRYGLINELFLLTEFLDGYVDGLQALEQGRLSAVQLLTQALDLIGQLHTRQIAHLDLWLGNVMVHTSGQQPKVIDLENCYIGPLPHFAAVLGFQFGFLYYYRAQQYIDEVRFDQLVEAALAQYPRLDRAAFVDIYQRAKHQHVGRKERHQLVSHGRFVAD